MILGQFGEVRVEFDEPLGTYELYWNDCKGWNPGHALERYLTDSLRGQEYSHYRECGWPMEDVIEAYELALAHHNLMS